MSRIPIPTLHETTVETRPTLEGVRKRLGWTPNLFRLMAISPGTLAAFVGLQSALARTMDIATIEAMGMAVSEGSGCEYCLQSHTFLGLRFAKLDSAELALNRQGTSRDPKRAAAVRFAKIIADTRGKVSDGDLADVRAAGFSDAETIAIAGLVAQFLMTNFMNNIARTELDFATDATASNETTRARISR
ncbi:carboxymuconolactone decarboxylase family protein [Bradyrhizobium sp.]|uniref:carboxymuconolactone decarboxylase family protein n=1 Tax=Bradyrhizobium sp. TaxID=376 RepID=UPI00260D6FF1|nr:carboxymuconolactone decarboxylase family protein [Bradyrhizobium sp.]